MGGLPPFKESMMKFVVTESADNMGFFTGVHICKVDENHTPNKYSQDSIVMSFWYRDTVFGNDGKEMRDVHIPWLAKLLCEKLNTEEIPSIDVSKCVPKEGDGDSFSNLGS
jgi:hypothetical protein